MFEENFEQQQQKAASHVVWNVLVSSRSLFVSLETNISSVGLLVRLSESFHDVFI